MALDKDIEADIREVVRNGVDLRELSLFQLLDAWLQWQGIVGYTGEILSVVEELKAFKGERSQVTGIMGEGRPFDR